MPWLVLGVAIAAAAMAAAVILVLIRAERRHAETALRLDQVAGRADTLARNLGDLAGRLDTLGNRLGDGLIRQTERTGESLRAVQERLAVVDTTGRTLTDVSTRVAALQQVLSNKQARGAFGERQLEDLIGAVLPPAAVRFQATLSTRVRADCLVLLPDPPGPIVIDAKFPLESYVALTDAGDSEAEARARRAFTADCVRHIRDIAERYIIPGETAEQALMFLPSEAVFAELHARCRGVIEESFRRRVWLVSPTTLWATLTTLRAVLRQARVGEEVRMIEAELLATAADATRLDDRVRRLQEHLRQAADDAEQVCRHARTIRARAERITFEDQVRANRTGTE